MEIDTSSKFLPPDTSHQDTTDTSGNSEELVSTSIYIKICLCVTFNYNSFVLYLVYMYIIINNVNSGRID